MTQDSGRVARRVIHRRTERDPDRLQRFLLAAGLFLAALALWLETSSVVHVDGRPVFALTVLATAVLCGAAPAALVAIGGGVAAWWFDCHSAGTGLHADMTDVAWLVPYALAAAAILTASSALRRWRDLSRRDGVTRTG